MRTFYFTNQTGDRWYAREVELKIESQTGLNLDNPFYANDGTPTPEIKQLDAGERPTMSPYEIVGQDQHKIEKSDGVVAYISQDILTFGCPMEMYYCVAMLGKPLYVISDLEKVHHHPWVKRYATKLFETVYEFIKYARENFDDVRAWLNYQETLKGGF